MSKNATIKCLPDGRIQFGTGRIETPRNKVLKVDGDVVCFQVNGKHAAFVNVSDYIRLSLWAHRLTMDHKILSKGVISYDNGYEHKSLAAAIMRTSKGERVNYKNKDHLDCRKENLVVKENLFWL